MYTCTEISHRDLVSIRVCFKPNLMFRFCDVHKSICLQRWRWRLRLWWWWYIHTHTQTCAWFSLKFGVSFFFVCVCVCDFWFLEHKLCWLVSSCLSHDVDAQNFGISHWLEWITFTSSKWVTNKLIVHIIIWTCFVLCMYACRQMRMKAAECNTFCCFQYALGWMHSILLCLLFGFDQREKWVSCGDN